MNERIRRFLIFATIVGTGSILILFDLPLLVILPLIIAIGFVLLILLGALPVPELKAMIASRLFVKKKKPSADTGAQKTGAAASQSKADETAAPQKKRLPFGLDALFRKKTKDTGTPAPGASQQKIPAQSGAKKRWPFGLDALFVKKQKVTPPLQGAAGRPGAAAAKKAGFSAHMDAIVSSFKAFGSVLLEKRKTDPDKLKKIDSMLDQAVSEKIDKSTPFPSAEPNIPVADAGMAGGPGALPAGNSSDDDPFLSLSGDELESGLLDDLDEDGPAPQPAPPAADTDPAFSVTLPDDSAGIPIGEADIPVPPQDLSSAAEDILKEHESPDSGDLPALEGLEAVDENLGELDNLSLDSVELDEDIGEDEEKKEPVPAAPVAPAPAQAQAGAATAPGWVDTKVKGADSGGAPAKSDQTEMAAFAAASGGDDDMLSSLTADIKATVKKQDLSLLRDLKDFRAPGTSIETELTDLHTVLNAAAEKQKKNRPAPAAAAKKQKAK